MGLIASSGIAIARQDTWEKTREFEEWVGIVADPERVAPLRTVVRALAAAGQDAGMGLSIEGGVVRFFHRWQLVAGRKL